RLGLGRGIHSAVNGSERRGGVTTSQEGQMTSTYFPIPADLAGFWECEHLHCPRPLTYLEHELLLASTGYGFSKAIAEMGSGIKAVTKSINGYNSLSGVPIDIGSEDPQARAARYQKNVDALLPVLGERWEKE